MTDKEKEKAYDKAIERTKKLYNNGITEEIFSELKEGDDEKIKIAILNHLKKMWGNCQDDVCGVHVEDAIAWLERQGKHTKQVHYPKFTFDDVLALQCCMETVKKVQEDKELYERLNLIHSKIYDAYRIEKQDEQASSQNNKNIDLTKILKDCPKGTKLYSTVLGCVTLEEINDYNIYPIVVSCKNGNIENFTADGKMIVHYDGECTLFPSKDQRDWSKFTAPWYKKEEKEKQERFDPKTLNVFDKVLARVYNGFWFADFVSVPGNDELCDIPALVGSSNFNEVVPYNEETKHLLGTADEAPEYYQYVDEDDEWEDED